MKKSEMAKVKNAPADTSHPFKKIGIAAVAAAAHAMKPKQDKTAQSKDTLPILLHEHGVV